MSSIRVILIATSVYLAVGLGFAGQASAGLIDFNLLVEARDTVNPVEIFGLTITGGEQFVGTFTADSDQFQGTGDGNLNVTDFLLTIGDTEFNYAALLMGGFYTDSVLEGIQTSGEEDATSGPFPAKMALVGATRTGAFVQFLDAFPPDIPVLNVRYQITPVPEPRSATLFLLGLGLVYFVAFRRSPLHA
jgi:hypothetical protein